MNYLGENPNLSRAEKLQLVQQTARGLAYLHYQTPPICHADIKPENVLVNDFREAALSDFGLSRVIQELDISTGLTTGAGPKGSQNYMAPELFEDADSKPTLEADVYAFGGLILAVMTGSPPFAQVNSLAKIMFRIIQGKVPQPDEHPQLQRDDPLWSLMVQCWARERQKRPILSDVEATLKEQNTQITISPQRVPLIIQEPAGSLTGDCSFTIYMSKARFGTWRLRFRKVHMIAKLGRRQSPCSTIPAGMPLELIRDGQAQNT